MPKTMILTWTDDAEKTKWEKLKATMNAVTALRPGNVTQLPEPQEGPGTNEWWMRYSVLEASCCSINKPGFYALIGRGISDVGFMTGPGSWLAFKEVDLIADGYETAPVEVDMGNSET